MIALNKDNKYLLAFSLVELMVTIVIISVLIGFSLSAYKTHMAKAKIISFINHASSVQKKVEDLHARGFVFGAQQLSNWMIYTSSSPDAPEGLLGLSYGYWGCVTLEFDTSYLGIGDTGRLLMLLVPSDTDGVMKWTCATHLSSESSYNQYLPKNCDNEWADVRDTSF